MSTYADPNGTPAEGTPAAQRQRLRASFTQLPAVDHNSRLITPKPEAVPVTVPDAIGMTEPATADAVLKAAGGLGVDRATVNMLLDSAAFVATVTGASADEITAAITARTSPAPRMAPNRGQGASGTPVPEAPKSLRDTLREKSRSISHL